MKDFTSSSKEIKFKVDDDVFECIKAIPAKSILEFSGLIDSLQQNDMGRAGELFDKLFTLVLKEESAKKFLARLEDKDNPITVNQIKDIIKYVLEEYSLRPTNPSENSSDGSPNPESGMNSTESSLDED